MKTVKRVISVILTLLLLPWTVLSGTAISDPSSVSLDILDPQLWEGTDAVQQIRSRPSGEGSMLYVAAAGTGEETLSITASLDQPLNLTSLRELAFSMYISGSGDCSFTVTFLCGGIYYNASTKVSAGGKAMAYIVLPQQVKGSVDALALTLTRQDEPIQSFSILSASGDERYSYAHVERFMSAGFESVTGALREEENQIFIDTENGGASFYPHYISKGAGDEDATVCLRIRSGHASGTIAVEGVSGTAPLPLVSGEHTYVFVIEGPYSDLKYVLNGVTTTQEEPLVITGAAVYPSKASAAEKIGGITSCRSDGKTVTVKGTISSETVVEHIEGQLALYMIPVWEEEEAVLREEPAAKMSISTRFELSAVPENLDVLYKYKVMILSGDKKISVAPAAFLNSGVAVTVADASVTGVHGTDTVGVFESNVSNVILDVYADRLLETDDVYAALLYNAGRSHYYFNRSYVEELDAQFSVHKSSGTHVYIRLFSSQENGFVYTAADQGSVLQMYALTSFLTERYQGAAGFIMGSGANVQYWDNVEDLASLTAIFAEIVQKKCPGAAAVVPVDSVYDDANAVDSPTGLSPKDPAVFLGRLSFTLSRRRAGSILLVYESVSHPEGTVLEASYLTSLIAACGHACDGGMLFWQPDIGSDADISALYESLCVEAMQTGLRSVVLSVTNLHESNLLFDRIKETVFDNTSAQLFQRMAAVNNTAAYRGMYPLWDFTDSYDIGGWVSGGGFGRVISAGVEITSDRALRTRLENAGGEAGLLLCWLDRPLDLSESSVVFSFGLHDIGQEGELSVIFGSGDSRAEYLLSQPQDIYFTVTCDLADFSAASAVEYIAIILRGKNGATLEISNVNVCSMVKTEQQLQQLVKGGQEKTQPANPAYYVILVSMTAITVAIFSILGRRGARRAHKNTQQKG
ncbi:MAG: hypothetical protein HFE66_05645 [Clostridiales bacterium]|nr:hypothetical protein [Clostridiales bacterium]